MTVFDMSAEEKEVFKKDIEIAIIKKWWPLAAFMFAFGMFAVKGTNWFDNNIATKSDVQRIENTLSEIKATIASYNQTNENTHFSLHNGITTNKHSIDSLGKIVASKGLKFTAVTQHKDKYGNLTYTPVN